MKRWLRELKIMLWVLGIIVVFIALAFGFYLALEALPFPWATALIIIAGVLVCTTVAWLVTSDRL